MDKNKFIIVPADICNLTCSFCCVAKCEESSSTIMSTGDAIKYADIIIRYIVKHKLDFVDFTFFGGEPLLNFDAVKIFLSAVKNCYERYGIPQTVETNMLTNGTVNIPEYIEFVNSLNEEYHIFRNNIQFSYDGPSHLVSSIAEKTDLTNIRKAIELTKDNKDWYINCMIVVSNQNADNFYELFKFLHLDKAVFNVMFFRLDIENSAYAELGNILLPQLQLVVDYIKESSDLENIIIARRKFGRYLNNTVSNTCCAGTSKIGLSANGILGGCHHDVVLVNSDLPSRTFIKLKSIEDIENYLDLTYSNGWYQIGKDGHVDYEDLCPAHYEKVKDDPDRKEFFRKVHEIVKQLDEDGKKEEEK